jgi:hypothetical protein
VKELTNANVRPGSGQRYLALVPELFQLSLSAREKQNNSLFVSLERREVGQMSIRRSRAAWSRTGERLAESSRAAV